jgi:hypothetical protein
VAVLPTHPPINNKGARRNTARWVADYAFNAALHGWKRRLDLLYQFAGSAAIAAKKVVNGIIKSTEHQAREGQVLDRALWGRWSDEVMRLRVPDSLHRPHEQELEPLLFIVAALSNFVCELDWSVVAESRRHQRATLFLTAALRADPNFDGLISVEDRRGIVSVNEKPVGAPDNGGMEPCNSPSKKWID